MFHREFAPKLAAIAPTLPGSRRSSPSTTQSGARTRRARRRRVRGRARGRVTRRATSGHAPPTTSTSSTRAARPGMPKGVMWRHEDIFFGALGGGNLGETPITSPEEIAERLDAAPARACPRARSCTAPRTGWRSARCSPAARSSSRPTGTSTRARLWELVAREQVNFLVIVGDASPGRWSRRSTRSTPRSTCRADVCSRAARSSRRR